MLHIWKKSEEKEILLDHGSTCDLYKDSEFVHNIQEATAKVEIESNGGVKLVKNEADVPAYETVYFADDALTNICGLSQLAKVARITFDSTVDNAFIVHRKDESKIKFKCNSSGLYILKTKSKD